jgi:hypothetical protein
LRQCGLPIGLSVDLAELGQKIKNMGKEKSRGNAFHLGSDQPANIFTVQSFAAQWEEELPTPAAVERWIEEELLSFIASRNILNDNIRATFRYAMVDGEAFLLCGDDRHFWMRDCHLPPGPSVKLADLAQKIKYMGKEKPGGNAFHFGGGKPANTFTVQSPLESLDGQLPPPSVVERWTEKELLSFIDLRNILNDKNRATFQNAEISGSIFLERGNIEDFWFRRCGLPIGLCGDLAELAQTIKTMGKEKSRGNAGHVDLTNRLTPSQFSHLLRHGTENFHPHPSSNGGRKPSCLAS